MFARVRMPGWTGCATGTASRNSASATAARCRAPPGAAAAANGSPINASRSSLSSAPSTTTCTQSTFVDRRIEALDAAIRERATDGPWAPLVARLRCLRGIDTLTGFALAVEIGDFHRFDSAQQLMAYVGLVPSEHSSGEHRRQGSITKAGNSHIRRLLIEAAWHARRRPKLSAELERRQRGQDPVDIERAWRCQQRLHRRWQRMAARGKPQQKIVVACARELAGFVWAIATQQPLRPT